jgi:hypothetical protein
MKRSNSKKPPLSIIRLDWSIIQMMSTASLGTQIGALEGDDEGRTDGDLDGLAVVGPMQSASTLIVLTIDAGVAVKSVMLLATPTSIFEGMSLPILMKMK